MTDYQAGPNAELPADGLLFFALADTEADAVADAIESGAGHFDGWARELLLSCLEGADPHFEIVRRRKRGDKGKPLRVFEDVVPWRSDGIPLEARAELVAMLRDGRAKARKKLRSGKRGRPPVGWTKEQSDGAEILSYAEQWAADHTNLPLMAYRHEGAELPRGAVEAAISAFVSYELVRRPASSKEHIERHAWRSLASWRAVRESVQERAALENNRD